MLKRLGEAGLLHKDAVTVSGETVWDEVKDVVNWNEVNNRYASAKK